MTGPALPTCPVIPAVCWRDSPRVLLHRHECRVNLGGRHCQDGLGDSEATFSTVSNRWRPGLVPSNHLVPDSATHTPAPASPVHQAPTRVWGNFEGKAATVLKPGELSSECGVVEAWGAAGAVARGHQCCLWLSGRLLRCLLISVNVPTQESEEQRSPERMFTLSLR